MINKDERIRELEIVSLLESKALIDFSFNPPNSPLRKLKHREVNDAHGERVEKAEPSRPVASLIMLTYFQTSLLVSLLVWRPQAPKGRDNFEDSVGPTAVLSGPTHC